MVTPDVSASIEAMRGTGHPLPPSLRAVFEPRLGHDLGRVRVHTGDRVTQTARALGARAFTVGQDIGFAGGEYVPFTTEGQRLLAHELVHSVQQRHGVGSGWIMRQPAPATPSAALAKYNKSCAGVNVLERLSREQITIDERVRRLTDRIKFVHWYFGLRNPHPVTAKEFVDRGVLDCVLSCVFGPGVYLVSEAVAVAEADCQLAEAEWQKDELASSGHLPSPPGRRLLANKGNLVPSVPDPRVCFKPDAVEAFQNRLLAGQDCEGKPRPRGAALMTPTNTGPGEGSEVP